MSSAGVQYSHPPISPHIVFFAPKWLKLRFQIEMMVLFFASNWLKLRSQIRMLTLFDCELSTFPLELFCQGQWPFASINWILYISQPLIWPSYLWWFFSPSYIYIFIFIYLYLYNYIFTFTYLYDNQESNFQTHLFFLLLQCSPETCTNLSSDKV